MVEGNHRWRDQAKNNYVSMKIGIRLPYVGDSLTITTIKTNSPQSLTQQLPSPHHNNSPVPNTTTPQSLTRVVEVVGCVVTIANAQRLRTSRRNGYRIKLCHMC